MSGNEIEHHTIPNDEMEAINTTDMYAAHVELPVVIYLSSVNQMMDRCEVTTSFVFYHPDEKHAESIAKYIQCDGPDENVQEILHPIYDKLFRKLLHNNTGTRDEEEEPFYIMCVDQYPGRDPHLNDKSFVFKPEPVKIRAYHSVIHNDRDNGIDFIEFFIPYDPFRFRELYKKAWGGTYIKPARSTT
jgi:hypothetical protein